MSISSMSRVRSSATHKFAFLLISASTTCISASQESEGNSLTPHNSLPAINVQGVVPDGFTTQSVSTTKSNKPLFETPQSITVVTRELMDARQVTTLDEAIETVAGVTSATLGRRGWDDFIIRGQSASDTMYLDGLRIGQANWIAQEIFGTERVEVIKGPASIYFGQVTPGGTVNLISKRPRPEVFNQVGFTLGDYGYRQGTFDFGRPIPSENGKAAFRVTGMAMNSDDPTDNVWFKNRYIAPSISLDFGARTDFTILAAINQRQYVRQQGIPLFASKVGGKGLSVPEGFYSGDTTIAPYDAEQKSIGYSLTHRFDNGWALNQNYRHLEMDLTGQLANTSGAVNLIPGASYGNFNRNVLSQDFWGRTDGLDTNVAKTFAWGGVNHSVMVGADLMYDRLFRDSRRCAIGNQNIFNPVYGKPVTACAITSIIDTTLEQTGFYVRDYIDFTDRLSLSMSLRHDSARLTSINYRPTPGRTDADSSANTGHVGLIYKVTNNIAPYISYATSFLPQTGITVGGNTIEPEKGKQSEVGVKFLTDDKRLSATLAAYSLTRNNLAQTDNANPDFQIAIGEQKTRGYEAEIAADLKNGWQLSAALSILDAYIPATGLKLSGVPDKTANVLANYRFSGALEGWGAGLGVRYVGSKNSNTTPIIYVTPGYTVADANVSYQGRGYRVQLNVKNIFDKDYYAGAASANWIPLGNPRTVMLKTIIDF